MSFETSPDYLKPDPEQVPAATILPMDSHIPPVQIMPKWFASALNWAFIYPKAPYPPFGRETPADFLVPALTGYGDWLKDDRAPQLMWLLDEFSPVKMRRCGPNVPEPSHVLWAANAIANDADVHAKCAEAGIPLIAAVATILCHDLFEDIADPYVQEAKKNNVPLSADDLEAIHTLRMQALDRLYQIFPDPDCQYVIKSVALDYMTDKIGLNPLKSGPARVAAQHTMPVDPAAPPPASAYNPKAARELVRMLNIKGRGVDKGQNGLSDGYWREQYEEAAAQGLIPANADKNTKRSFGMSDEDLREAVLQLFAKAPAVEREGVSRWVQDAYKRVQEKLLVALRKLAEPRGNNLVVSELLPQPDDDACTRGSGMHRWRTAAQAPAVQ